METPETTSETPDRTCANCNAAMERHQDWCLECGAAVPGRLAGARPGWRAVGTTLALTLVLVSGAGAASYAALSSDANREAIASAPGDGTPVAQAPPGVPAPAAPVIPAPGAETVETPAPKLPTAPKTTAQVPTPAPTPLSTPTPLSSPSVTPKQTPATPSTTRNSTPEPKADPTKRGQGTSASSGGGNASGAKLEALPLGAESVSVYDPYKRAVGSRDTVDAYDSDSGTAFALTAKGDSGELQVGLTVDLGSRKKVRGVALTVGGGGGRAEIYATDSAALPPDILDTRWDHPASRPNLSGTEQIRFPKSGANYRYVTFWFTAPPKSGRTILIKELKVLG